jgi:hypothetical protein
MLGEGDDVRNLPCKFELLKPTDSGEEEFERQYIRYLHAKLGSLIVALTYPLWPSFSKLVHYVRKLLSII